MELNVDQLIRIAGFEINALHFSKVLPFSLEDVRIKDPGTIIYDIDGNILFHRIPLERRRRIICHADVAVLDIFAEPLLAVDPDTRWNEAVMIRGAVTALHKKNPQVEYDETRFVAYSYPKLAVQFLKQGHEVAMLELYSWNEVPIERAHGEGSPYFERWSLIKDTPEEIKKENAENFEKRVAIWEADELAQLDSTLISVDILNSAHAVLKKSDTRDVHYAPRAADHHICYELRGQQTHVWCVPASVEMVLNFYRWRYSQPRIAAELEQGTCEAPSGLPYGDEIKVVNTLEKLSSSTLNANMYPNPNWTLYRDEIREHQPLISFIPHHSRTVAGYTESIISLLGELPYRGLLVYDPWPQTDCDHPENGGRITRWENFKTQTYRFAFTAKMQHV